MESMEENTFCKQYQGQIQNLVKIGLLRELYQQRYITQAQFEQLMRLYRS